MILSLTPLGSMHEELQAVLDPYLCADPFVDQGSRYYDFDLPDSTRIHCPLGHLGKLAIGNDAGRVVITVPLALAGMFRDAFREDIEHSQMEGDSASFKLTLAPGECLPWSLGPLGQIALYHRRYTMPLSSRGR